MTYIVTTKRPASVNVAEMRSTVSRRTVATLAEAKGIGHAAVERATSARGNRQDWQRKVAALPESGGTVGPLPDGTIIEVTKDG